MKINVVVISNVRTERIMSYPERTIEVRVRGNKVDEINFKWPHRAEAAPTNFRRINSVLVTKN
jgi:hypothetical protein